MRLTFSPRLSSRLPMEAAASPLPSEDTTPPVTKTYFADMNSSPLNVDWVLGVGSPAHTGITDWAVGVVGVHNQLWQKSRARQSQNLKPENAARPDGNQGQNRKHGGNGGQKSEGTQDFKRAPAESKRMTCANMSDQQLFAKFFSSVPSDFCAPLPPCFRF